MTYLQQPNAPAEAKIERSAARATPRKIGYMLLVIEIRGNKVISDHRSGGELRVPVLVNRTRAI
jgi:hypothetical protein